MTKLAIRTNPNPLTWVFAGDSITAGVAHTHGQRCWVEHLHERIRFELGRHRDVLINTGIAGWTTGGVWADYEHLVARFQPDIVSIALGMNDSMAGPGGLASFADTLGELARSSQELGAVVVLHTPNTIGTGAFNGSSDVAAYADAIRDIAAELGTVLVDHHAHWHEAFGGDSPWPWLDEPVHPNARGHQEMAALTLSVLECGPMHFQN